MEATIRSASRSLALVMGALLFGIVCRPALAQVPTRAQLTFLGDGSRTKFVGVRLPNGDVDDFGNMQDHVILGLFLMLNVTLKGSPPQVVDVTSSPNTSFSSAPATLTFSDNSVRFGLGDADRTFSLTGSYTASGTTVADSLGIKLRILQAPDFYDAGPVQAALLQQFAALSVGIQNWLTTPGVSPDTAMTVNRLRIRLSIFLRDWWTRKFATAVVLLGNSLSDNGAPTALLIQLSHLVLAMSRAHLVGLGISPLPGGPTGINAAGPFLAPWMPANQVPMVAIFSPPVIVFWWGL